MSVINLDRTGTGGGGSSVAISDAQIVAAIARQSNANLITDANLTKLMSLEDSPFKGKFMSLAQLQTAFPTALAGDYAHVDMGVGNDPMEFLWDDNDIRWVEQTNGSLTPSPIEIAQAIVSLPNTNLLSDAQQDFVDRYIQIPFRAGNVSHKVTEVFSDVEFAFEFKGTGEPLIPPSVIDKDAWRFDHEAECIHWVADVCQYYKPGVQEVKVRITDTQGLLLKVYRYMVLKEITANEKDLAPGAMGAGEFYLPLGDTPEQAT